jgi:hypothetical protein
MRRSTGIAALTLCALAFSSALAAQQVPQNLYFKFNEGTGTTSAN